MKKVFSVVLAFIMAFSVSAAAFSSYAADKCNCGTTPVIYVTGFATTDLVANPGTDEQYSVYMPEATAVILAVAKLIVPAILLRITGNYDAFADSICDAFNDMMRDAACDDSGNPINESVDIKFRVDPQEEHGYRCDNRFNYDWREDVFEIAAELNDYIEKTKELTRHDKVVLKGESMGGAVVMTYLKEYGCDSVDTVIMQSSAFNGITLIGGLFTGDINIRPEAVVNYVGNFIEGNDTVTVLCRSLYKAVAGFVFDPVCGILTKVIDNCKDRVYDGCLKDLYGNYAGMWAFVPNECYEQAKDYMLDETENAELIKKIDAYHYDVMAHTQEILDDAMAKGMKLAIISNYGKAAVPATSNDLYQSDFLIDTTRTSLGATCADFGSTFDDGYTQSVADGHNHISCDGEVDASTCLYPEYTWFVKDMMHTWYTEGYYAFTWELAQSKTQPDVFGVDGYPQFLYNNQEDKTIVPLTEENSNTRNTDVDLKAVAEEIMKNK